MKKKFVGCEGWRLRVREESVWGEYCVGKVKGEEKGGKEKNEADGESCSCIAGRYSVKRVYLS
jgi:hypothetical protein